MNKDVAPLKKVRVRGKSFLAHNFNKAKLADIDQATQLDTETMPLKTKTKKLKEKIILRKLNETFLLSPWNISIYNENKENIFY